MRETILRGLIRVAFFHRRLVFIVSVILTLGLGIASEMLQIDPRWSALLPESIPVVKEFNAIDKDYLQPGNMVIAITGSDPTTLEKITDEAALLLKKQMLAPKDATLEEIKKTKRYIRHIYGKVPADWIETHGLRLRKPKDNKRAAKLFGDPRLLSFLSHLNDDFESEYADTESVANQEREVVGSLDAVQQLVWAIDTATTSRVSQAITDRTVHDLTIGKPYMFSLDNTMSLLMVAVALPTDEFGEMPSIDRKIEQVLAPLEKKYPEYKIERTGMTAIGRDELDSVGPETQGITMIALVLLFVILIWNFRSGLTPFIALAPVILGIIWSMGIIGLTLGTLNLLTVMIMVILLGLGIDFSIHIANRFQEEIASGRSIEDSLHLVLLGTGKSVITGALTTAIAFFVLMISEMRAIFEFGFCAGVGLLVTLIATFWILPSIMVWRARRWQRKGRAPRGAPNLGFLGAVAELSARRKWMVSILALSLLGLGVVASLALRWEYNFLNLEPEGLRSVELQSEIVDKYKLSVTTAMLTAGSINESRQLRKALKRSRAVGDVDDISMWVSRADFSKSVPYLKALRKALNNEPSPMPLDGGDTALITKNRKLLTQELNRLWANMVEIQALAFTGGQDRVFEKTVQLVGTREARDDAPLRLLAASLVAGKKVNWASLNGFATEFDKQLTTRIRSMVASEKPVTLADVPQKIRDLYIGKTTKRFLIHIMPRKNLWNRNDLERFRAAVSNVSPKVTGTPHLILEMNDQTSKQGRIAMLFAIVAILIVLVIDFRRPLLAVIAFVPLLLGLALTFATMWVLGEKLNYLNTIGFPVIIGIGVDNGVHFLHRYMQEGRDRLRQAVTSVGRAMLMTSVTTMIGFGSLLFYSMRGMRSMGLVLFVGVGWCFVVTITVLPALTRFVENRFVTGTITEV